MSHLVRANVRYLQRTWATSVASIVSLALGVMCVVAVHALSERIVTELGSTAMRPDYQYVVKPVLDGTDNRLLEADYFDLRRRWRSSGTSAVLGMVPVIEGFSVIDGGTVPVMGFDPIADIRLDQLAGQRAPPFIDAPTVTVFGSFARVGDVVTAQAQGEPIVVGATEPGRFGRMVGDLPTVQSLLGRGGELDAIWLRTAQPEASLGDRLLPGFAAGFVPSTGDIPELQKLAADGVDRPLRVSSMTHWDPARTFADAISFNLGALGSLALFVGGFLVYQAAHASIRRRQFDVQRLVVLGVDRSTIRALFVLEGLIVGVLGSVVGVLLAYLVVRTLAGDVFDGGWDALSAWAVGKGVVLGVASAAAAAFFASRARPFAVTPVVAAVIGSLALALTGLAFWDASGLAGALGAILGLCLLQLVLIVPAATRGLGYLAERFSVGRLTRRAAARGAIRRLADVRLAIGALSVAVAVAVGIGLMVESFRADFIHMLDQRMPPGLFIRNGASLDDARVRRLAGVQDVRRYARGSGSTPDGPVEVTAVTIDRWEAARYGWHGDVPPGVFVNELAARRYGALQGARLSFEIGGETVTSTVAHVFRDFGEPTPRLIVPMELLDSDGLISDRLTVITEPGVDTASVQAAITALSRDVEIRDQAQIREIAIAVFDRTFVLTRYLTVVALIVAVVGLYGALLVFEARRRREFKLLHTLGLSKGDTLAMSLVESLAVGVVAVVVALPLGLAISFVLCGVVNPRAFGWTVEFAVVAEPIVVPCILGVAAAAVAGVLPLFRSDRALTNQLSYEPE